MEIELKRMYQVLEEAGVERRFSLFKNWQQLTSTKKIEVGLIHVDGEHSQVAVEFDLRLSQKLLNSP